MEISGRQSHEKINKSNGIVRITFETEAQITLLFPHRRLRIRIGKYTSCAVADDGATDTAASLFQNNRTNYNNNRANPFRSLFATRVTIFSMCLLRTICLHRILCFGNEYDNCFFCDTAASEAQI